MAAFTASAGSVGSASSFNGTASFAAGGAVTRYDWSFGDGAVAEDAGPAPAHVYAKPGTYTTSLQVTDGEGCSVSESFTGQTAYCNADPGAAVSHSILVAAPPVAPAPLISRLRQSASRWRSGSHLAQISSRRRRRAPVGTTFSFEINAAATVTFAFQQRRSGRRVGRRCLSGARGGAAHRRCTLSHHAGSLSFAAHAGANAVRFQGRISRSKRLRPGGYTLAVTAANAAGLRSKPATLRFRIAG